MSNSFDEPPSPGHSGPERRNEPMFAAPRAERRRAPRWKAHVPVFVYAYTGDQAPFHEEAYSVVVSDLGALLIMATAVPLGEHLLLTNKTTGIEQECLVAWIGQRDGPSVEVAVEFATRSPLFWRITAPPASVALGAPIKQHRRAR